VNFVVADLISVHRRDGEALRHAERVALRLKLKHHAADAGLPTLYPPLALICAATPNKSDFAKIDNGFGGVLKASLDHKLLF